MQLLFCHRNHSTPRNNRQIILHRYIILCRSDSDNEPHRKNKFYLVTEAALLRLFVVCMYCGSAAVNTNKVITGTFVKISQLCRSCLKKRVWESQPFVGSIPLGNILMSAAILFSGSLPSKALRLFRFMDVAAIARVTFFRHQEKYLQPAVRTVWSKQQESIFADLKQKRAPLALAGDGRADSPGHSAKYGTYTLVDLNSNKIIATQLVAVSSTSNDIYSYLSYYFLFSPVRLKALITWKKRV